MIIQRNCGKAQGQRTAALGQSPDHGKSEACMINEMTEAVAGIDLYKATGNPENLCEELGDVLLQVVLLSQIAEEEGLFTIENVIEGISRKIIRRHPHVFGSGSSLPRKSRDSGKRSSGRRRPGSLPAGKNWKNRLFPGRRSR